jgi:transmembrane sensor
MHQYVKIVCFFLFSIGCFVLSICNGYKRDKLNQDIVLLFLKHIESQCSAAEREEVLSIIEAGSYLEEWEFALTEDAKQLSVRKDVPLPVNPSQTERLHQKIIDSVNHTNQPISLKRITLRYVAAAAVLAFVCGLWFFYYQDKNSGGGQSRIAYANDVVPGNYGATLQIGNAKGIILSDKKKGLIIGADKIAYNDGSQLISRDEASKNELYTVSTATGNTYMLTLPDGTQAWLNAASQIQFPSAFKGKERRIRMIGEAYFQVAKDSAHPFIVTAENQEVKVLGTHFNVNSYADEKHTTTTLEEGSIAITSSKANVSLVAGQQATIDANGIAQVSDVDPEVAIAWKNNKFVFENNDIQSVMRMIQRWYNVEVVYSGPLPEASFGGKVSRFDNISSVLSALETTGGVHFKVEGRKIYVSK